MPSQNKMSHPKQCLLRATPRGMHCKTSNIIWFYYCLKGWINLQYKALGLQVVDMVNTLRPRQNGRHFADDMFKCIFLNKNAWILIKISLKFVPKGSINNIPALVQIMAWCRPGDKPLFEPMLVRMPTHICVTRPQWVNNDTKDSRKYQCHVKIKCPTQAMLTKSQSTGHIGLWQYPGWRSKYHIQ